MRRPLLAQPNAESQATSRWSFPIRVFKKTLCHQQHPQWHRTSPNSTMSLCQSPDWFVQASRQVTYKKQQRVAKGKTPTLSSSSLSAKMNLSCPFLAQRSKYILETKCTPPICKEEKEVTKTILQIQYSPSEEETNSTWCVITSFSARHTEKQQLW